MRFRLMKMHSLGTLMFMVIMIQDGKMFTAIIKILDEILAAFIWFIWMLLLLVMFLYAFPMAVLNYLFNRKDYK